VEQNWSRYGDASRIRQREGVSQAQTPNEFPEAGQMTRERTLTVHRSLYLSEEMWAKLQQVAKARDDGTNENDLIRDGIRLVIESDENVIGSRRHFGTTLQARVNTLESRLGDASRENTATVLFYLNIAIQLLAIGLAHLLTASGKGQITPQQLLQRAVISARKEESLFAAQVRAVREMTLADGER
jgi:hypothetical protein